MHADPATTLCGTGVPTGRQLAIRSDRRIAIRNGVWFFLDPIHSQEISLEPLFESSRWQISALGRALGIGRRTLTRIIDKSLGIAGKTWLREIRIVRACHLIREGGKIANLSRALGFRHVPDFSTEFRSQVGMSPTEFLKSEKKRMFQPERAHKHLIN